MVGLASFGLCLTSVVPAAMVFASWPAKAGQSESSAGYVSASVHPAGDETSTCQGPGGPAPLDQGNGYLYSIRPFSSTFFRPADRATTLPTLTT